MIRLNDLVFQYNSQIKQEIQAIFEELIQQGSFINGHYLKDFENEFCRAYGLNGCGCSNGTAALYIALKALNIGVGDEVITTPNTFIATAEAICHAGAKPVFVDIDPDAYNIDPIKLKQAITNKTKAIIPVHLYGNPCDMDAIMQIAKEYKLFVIEDTAQAHFSTYKGRLVGTFGDFSSFSFFPGKNLGAYGDAGFVFAKTENDYAFIKKYIDHGRISKYEHDMIGFNFRMDDIQAAVLTVKLKYMEEWTKERREIAKAYDGFFKPHGFKLIQELPGCNSSYHLYIIRVKNRDQVMRYLSKNGIASSVHYPIPLHMQPALQHLGYKVGDFPIAEEAAKEIISLPIYPGLTEQQVRFIAAKTLKIAII